MCVTLVQEHRLASRDGDLKLLLEHASLHVRRREVAEEIQSAFTHRDGFRIREQRTQFSLRGVGAVFRMMRMDTSGEEQAAGIGTAEFVCLAAMSCIAAGDDAADDTLGLRTGDDKVPIEVEAV